VPKSAAVVSRAPRVARTQACLKPGRKKPGKTVQNRRFQRKLRPASAQAVIAGRISACRPGGDENWVDGHEPRRGRHSLRRHRAGTTPQARGALQVRERPSPSRFSGAQSRLSGARYRLSGARSRLSGARSVARHAPACAKEYSRMPGTKTIAQLIISSSGVREAPRAAPGARQALQPACPEPKRAKSLGRPDRDQRMRGEANES
jgi:hypothetical protein